MCSIIHLVESTTGHARGTFTWASIERRSAEPAKGEQIACIMVVHQLVSLSPKEFRSKQQTRIIFSSIHCRYIYIHTSC